MGVRQAIRIFDIPKWSIKPIIDVGPFKARLFYKEMQQANLCFKRNKPVHRGFECLEKEKDKTTMERSQTHETTLERKERRTDFDGR